MSVGGDTAARRVYVNTTTSSSCAAAINQTPACRPLHRGFRPFGFRLPRIFQALGGNCSQTLKSKETLNQGNVAEDRGGGGITADKGRSLPLELQVAVVNRD